jgi:alpha-amylase
MRVSQHLWHRTILFVLTLGLCACGNVAAATPTAAPPIAPTVVSTAAAAPTGLPEPTAAAPPAGTIGGVVATPAPGVAAGPRTVLVHLFEWKWTDIAKECENYLGPKGFAAVQVSPPNEHALIRQSSGNYPWWERYQPVSYSIDKSRSGIGAEFRDMVARCHNAGVDIYVDAVINHMTGGGGGDLREGFFHGSSGSPYTKYDYPGTYSINDFHTCHGDISNYGDSGNVQNCELVGLADLNTGSQYVRTTIANYLIGLAKLGVRGFRVDAVKHISAADMAAIADIVDAAVEPDPYYYQEVIDNGGEAVQASDYFGIGNGQGDVTEFKYQDKLSKKFLNATYAGGHERLAELRTFGESWGLMPSDRAIVFTSNHDTQRGHAGGAAFISYHNGRLEDLASVFMLAWPYGYPSIMSSYALDDTTTDGTDAGPPSDADGNTNSVYPAGSNTPSCFDQTPGKGWVCEHRWRPIGNMVAFRNYTNAAWHTDNWWDNGNNQIAFSRGDRGFVAINREDGQLSQTLQTGLPAGVYCDVINGDFDPAAGTCSGPTVTVDASGNANISIGGMNALAIYGGAKLGVR